MILLVGLVTKNGILLVDYADTCASATGSHAWQASKKPPSRGSARS